MKSFTLAFIFFFSTMSISLGQEEKGEEQAGLSLLRLDCRNTSRFNVSFFSVEFDLKSNVFRVSRAKYNTYPGPDDSPARETWNLMSQESKEYNPIMAHITRTEEDESSLPSGLPSGNYMRVTFKGKKKVNEEKIKFEFYIRQAGSLK